MIVRDLVAVWIRGRLPLENDIGSFGSPRSRGRIGAARRGGRRAGRALDPLVRDPHAALA